MKKLLLFRYFLPVLVCLALLLPQANAQTPTDALMMDKGQICFAALYTHDTWDTYNEDTLDRQNGNIGTLTRQTFLPMLALGIHDRLNVLAALPRMKTEASGGQMQGASGFQDWGLWLKGKALDLQVGPGNFTAHAVAGLTGKASNYLADYAPFSLGLGCTELSLRGILQYELDMGLFVRALAAWHLRGNTRIERDYYYTTQGYYSDEVDMPNAVTWSAVAGTWLLEKSLKLELSFDGLDTQGGHGIRRQDAGFPSNKMSFKRISGEVRYFLPFVKGLSVLASGGHMTDFRNMGQSTHFTGGLTYQFGLWGTEGTPGK